MILTDISYFQAIWMGLLEGLTEFLPVSSTAHLALAPNLFHQPNPGAAFDAVVQLGPILAIVIYFYADLLKYVKGILRTKTPGRVAPEDVDARLGWYTLFASVPILFVGLALHKYIERDFRRVSVIAIMFILIGLALLAAERIGSQKRNLERLTVADALLIGLAQCLALVPGTSRSGIVLTAGLFRGLDRESVTRFSFLISVPALVAAGLFELLKEVILKPGAKEGAGPMLVGTLVAGVSAYLVIRWFLGYMRRRSTGVFIAYRLIAGVILLALLGGGVLKDRLDEPLAKTEATVAVAPHTEQTR